MTPTAPRPLPSPFLALQALLLAAGLATLAWRGAGPHTALWGAAWLACAWAPWAWWRGRVGVLQVLLVQAAALATVTSETGLLHWHWLFKPAVMAIALVFVATCARSASAGGHFDTKSSFLMVEGFFIPGLVSFLLAHVAYVVLFGQGVRWFARPLALAATLAVGSAMYAFLWQGGLPAELRIPVAVYVTVIALMAAQALGRAGALGDRAARQVALGACLFMLSDSLLATNRFVQPLPLAQVGVLATYFAAQAFIVHGMVQALARRG